MFCYGIHYFLLFAYALILYGDIFLTIGDIKLTALIYSNIYMFITKETIWKHD